MLPKEKGILVRQFKATNVLFFPSKYFLLISLEKQYFMCLCVQLLSHVWFFATPWTVAHQASLSLPEFAQIYVQWVGYAIQSSHPLLPPVLLPSIFPISGAFSMSQLFASVAQSIGVSASASVLPMNIQGGFPLGLTGLISLQSKGFSRVFSNTAIQTNQFFGTQPS